MSGRVAEAACIALEHLQEKLAKWAWDAGGDPVAKPQGSEQ